MSVETMENTHHNHPETEGTAKRVAEAFLDQYYDVLGNHPELVHKFYVDSSVVTRPVSDGSVSSVTTVKGIDDLIQSLYAEGESYVDISKTEAQFSYGDGLVIMVSGLIGSEELKKQFSQVFFLAPQERGYYVLTDMFHYNEETDGVTAVVEKDTSDVSDDSEINAVKVKAGNEKQETKSTVVNKEITIEPKSTPGQKKVSSKAVSSNGKANGKLSYASIIKVPASSTPAAQTSPAASKPVVKAPQSPTLDPVAPAMNSSNVKEPSNVTAPCQSDVKKSSIHSKDKDQKDESLSISVWELPLSIKPYQLERSFGRKFGPVKQGGIQIRNAQGKNGPICYAFIEFESADSAEAAIKASPVSIDGRLVIVKRKMKKGKNNGKPRVDSPQSDNNSQANGRRHRDSSHDSSNAGLKNENDYVNSKSNVYIALPVKPEIDEDGFQIVSRNGKWKTLGN